MRTQSRCRPFGYVTWRLLALGAVIFVSGCAGAFRDGVRSERAGDWDAAVAYYQRASEDNPNRPEYRIALERATLGASRAHIARGRAFEAERELGAAVREYRTASEFDPSNTEVAGRAANLEIAIRDRIEAERPPAPIQAMRDQARRETLPPLLDPGSRDPLTFEFRETSLQDLLDFIGDATGTNVTYDGEFLDSEVSFRIDGMSLEATLDHILSINQLFYKVLNPRTIIVVPETAAKRGQYDEQVLQTFFVSNADVDELSQMLSQIVRVPGMAVQPAVIPNSANNTITVRATAPVTAVIEQVIAANDKPLAEIIIDVEILEVNREHAKRFGLNLTDYAIGGALSPEVAPPDTPIAPSGIGSPPPFNVNTVSQGVSTADFYLAVPAAVVRFLESDSHTNLVAKPQLRGQEGQTMTLNLGEDIPVPTTAFTAIAAGGASVNPLTSFTYRAVGVIVEMTPRVTYENKIILDLVLENSTLGANIDVAGTSLPTFGSRRVVTRLRLRDGESNLLAGLIREEDRNALRGVAGTLRVPLLKSLLGDNDRGTRKTEIVMLLTPRIVRTHELTQRDVSPIHIGTQTRLALSGPPPVIASQPDAGAPPLPPTGQPDVREPIGAAAPVAEPPAASVDAPEVPDPVPPAAVEPDLPEAAEAPDPDGAAGRADPLPAARVLVTPPWRAVPGRQRTLHGPGVHQRRLATVHGLAHGDLRPECPARAHRPGGRFHASGRSPGKLHAASRC
jgi:general secretion pathway protein D